MDRAIIEVLNTNALIIISVIIISLITNFYFYTNYTVDTYEKKLIYNKINNLIYKIYMDSIEYKEIENVTLILNRYIYLEGNGSNVLTIKIGNDVLLLHSPLKVCGRASSNVFIFSYLNGTIFISKP